MSQIDGISLFIGLYTVLNDKEEIRIQHFVQSTNHEQVALSLSQMYETMTTFNQPKPQIFYVDRCCQDRNMLEENVKSLKDNLSRPSLLELPEKVIFCDSDEAANIHANNLQQTIHSLSNGRDLYPIGFDCEWNFDLNQGGKISLVAMIQVAIPGVVYLFHLPKLKVFPPALQSIIADPLLLRVGVNVAQDLTHLQADCKIIGFPRCQGGQLRAGPFIDLRTHAKRHGINYRKGNLKELCELILNRTLNKSEDGPRTKKWWTTGRISEDMREYAALDAYSSLLIYLRISENYSPFSSASDLTIQTEGSEVSTTDPSKPFTRVKLDIFHAMKRILDCIPKKHAFQFVFAIALRDAFFIIDPTDRKKLEEYLEKDGRSFELEYNCNASKLLPHLRRAVPIKNILRPRLEQVRDKFNSPEFIDPYTKKKLLSPAALEEFENLLRHVDQDCLSDPPHMPMYYLVRVSKKTGLPTYRCIRGTSDVEGAVHQKIAYKFRAWNAGPQYANAALTILRDRHNIRASEKHRKNFPKLGHYAHFLIDYIQEFTRFIFRKQLFPWWKQTSQDTVPTETFGIVPCISKTSPYYDENINLAELEGYKPSMRYLATRMKSQIPFLPVHTKHERLLFAEAIPQYTPINGGRNAIDFEKMADHWNKGILQTNLVSFGRSPSPDGINIFRKLKEHLSFYFKEYYTSIIKRNIRKIKAEDLKNLRDLLHFETDHTFLDVGTPRPIEFLDDDVRLLHQLEETAVNEMVSHLFDDSNEEDRSDFETETSRFSSNSSSISSVSTQTIPVQITYVIPSNSSPPIDPALLQDESPNFNYVSLTNSRNIQNNPLNQAPLNAAASEIPPAGPRNRQCKLCKRRYYSPDGNTCPGGTKAACIYQDEGNIQP